MEMCPIGRLLVSRSGRSHGLCAEDQNRAAIGTAGDHGAETNEEDTDRNALRGT